MWLSNELGLWASCVQQNYIRKLVQLFRTCEDLENLEGLRLMFKIVKGISELLYLLVTVCNIFVFFHGLHHIYLLEFLVITLISSSAMSS